MCISMFSVYSDVPLSEYVQIVHTHVHTLFLHGECMHMCALRVGCVLPSVQLTDSTHVGEHNSCKVVWEGF